MPFSVMEALQAFGAGRQMALQDRQQQRAENLAVQQETGRARAGQQIASGDFTGAAATAFSSGLEDSLPKIKDLSQAHQQQLYREAGAGLSAAQALRQAPAEQRAALAQQLAPQLRAEGFDDAHLAQLSADLSDNALDGHIHFTQGVLQHLGPQTRTGQPYRWEDNAGNLMTLGPDGQPTLVYRDPTPRVTYQPDGRGGYIPIQQPNNAPQMGQQGGFQQAPQQAPVDPIPVSTPEEADQLAPGTPILLPDGSTGVVPGGPTQPASGGFLSSNAYPPGQW